MDNILVSSSDSYSDCMHQIKESHWTQNWIHKKSFKRMGVFVSHKIFNVALYVITVNFCKNGIIVLMKSVLEVKLCKQGSSVF